MRNTVVKDAQNHLIYQQRTSRQPGHFEVTKVVEQVIMCKRQRSKEPGHFEVRKSSSQVTECTFPSKKLTTLAADCFTVKIKQIKRTDMVTFLFSVHTITEAKQ